MKKVHSTLQDRRVRKKPNFKKGQLDRTAAIRKVFSKGDSRYWSNNLYTITEIIHATTPSDRNKYLPERYNENLLRSSNLTHAEETQVMKNLILIH